MALLAGVLLWLGSPASADVDSVSGSAFGASVTSSLLGPVVPPSPAGISGSAAEPDDGYGPVESSSLGLFLPAVVTTGVLNASTSGGNLAGDDNSGFASSAASVADVSVLINALAARSVASTCRSDGNGSSGSSTIVDGTLGGSPLLAEPGPNTVVSVPGLLTAVLNEQIVSNTPGETSIIVRAVHVVILQAGLLPGAPLLDVVLGESRCRAAGPDVNMPTTTSSSTSSSSSSSTSTSTSSPSSTSSTSSTSTSSTSTSTSTTTSTVPPDPGLCPSSLTPSSPMPEGYTRMVGTEGSDRIFGTPGRDVIFALGGDDEVFGMAGDDIIFGGEGNDRLVGGSLEDSGGDGNDILCGGAGYDQLVGQDGDDQLAGGDGYDDLIGGPGDDTLLGGPGNDRLVGGPGNNTLNGGTELNACQDPPPTLSAC